MIYPEYEERLKALGEFERPSMAEIESRIFEGFDDFVGTKADIEAREQELKDQVSKEWAAENQKYADQYGEIVGEFVEALHKEYGTGVKELDEAVYREADQRGHAEGVSSIESAYMDLIEIAKLGLKAGMKLEKETHERGYLD